MLRYVKDAAVVRLFWRITLDNLFLTRFLRSHCEIMASCTSRLHLQTLVLCQCIKVMYC